MREKKKDFPISCLYVDDLIYVGTSKDMVVEFKNAMMKKIQNVKSWIDEIFSWHSSEAISRENFYFIRKVCCRSFQEIQHVTM